MGFNSYKGSIKLGAGLTPAATGYPLMQSCDIQVDEDGKTLAEFIEEGGGGVNFTTDETLSLKDGVLSVNVASAAEEDNTLPISSAAVATTVGNIEILLKTI